MIRSYNLPFRVEEPTPPGFPIILSACGQYVTIDRSGDTDERVSVVVSYGEHGARVSVIFDRGPDRTFAIWEVSTGSIVAYVQGWI